MRLFRYLISFKWCMKNNQASKISYVSCTVGLFKRLLSVQNCTHQWAVQVLNEMYTLPILQIQFRRFTKSILDKTVCTFLAFRIHHQWGSHISVRIDLLLIFISWKCYIDAQSASEFYPYSDTSLTVNGLLQPIKEQ